MVSVALSIGFSERTENLALLLSDGFQFIFHFLCLTNWDISSMRAETFILFLLPLPEPRIIPGTLYVFNSFKVIN